MAFIVFEGLDGSGKSSLMGALSLYLSQRQIPWMQTREPGGTHLGDEIRKLLLQKGAEAPQARTELLLYEASRAQLVELVIKPELANKKWVLCDRFTASSVAFQGGGREITRSSVDWLNQFATAGLRPDLVILLDLPVEVSQERQKKRQMETGQTADRMESENQDFHEKVRQSFLQQAKEVPQDWLILSALKTPDVLAQEMISELKTRGFLPREES